jgi:hypothetical protein
MVGRETEHARKPACALRRAVADKSDHGGQMQRRHVIGVGVKDVGAHRVGLRRAARIIVLDRLQ